MKSSRVHPKRNDLLEGVGYSTASIVREVGYSNLHQGGSLGVEGEALQEVGSQTFVPHPPPRAKRSERRKLALDLFSCSEKHIRCS